MTVEIVYDASNFISASIEEVFKTIGEATLIVILVILLFLGSFRSVLIPIVTIPLSLVGVCFVLFALGYSINLLTLLAMVLAIGLVVDDAIVVLENIHRHIEEGLEPVDAADRRHEGDIRSDRLDDDHACRRLCADRLHAGADRHAFPRVRLYARRRGDHIRHRRGDAVADDVVKAACSRMAGARGFAGFVDRSFTRLENWYGRRLAGSLDYRP